jgi:hypothetical protein
LLIQKKICTFAQNFRIRLAKRGFMRGKLLLILLVVAAATYAQTSLPNDSITRVTEKTPVFQGYSGGMMLRAGYLFGKNPSAILPAGASISPQGMTMGIGGSLRINLWKHLRVGCEGYVSTMNSGATDMRNVLQSGSYVRVGSGGVLADACWRMEKIWPFIGAAVGGGAMRTLYVVEGTEDDWQPEDFAMLTKQGFGYVNPYIGMDWCMTKRVHMTLRMDWMLAFADKQILLPTGPRFFFGFMFCH